MVAKHRRMVMVIASLIFLVFPALAWATVTGITVTPSRNPVGANDGFNFFVDAQNDSNAVTAGAITFTLSLPDDPTDAEITGISGQGNCTFTSTTAECTDVDIVSGGSVSWLVDVEATDCDGGNKITLTAGFHNDGDTSTSADISNSGTVTCQTDPTAITLSSLTATPSAGIDFTTFLSLGLAGSLVVAVIWRRRH